VQLLACLLALLLFGGLNIVVLIMLLDEGMTHGSSILAYLVFSLGRASAEGMGRPISTTVWRGPGARLRVQCKNSEEQDLV
jgi:hypothetical protein